MTIAEFDLVIGLLRTLGDDHVVVRAANRGDRLHEKDRLGRDRRTRLLRVQPIVEADRDDFGHRADARPEPRRARNERQARRIDRSEPRERGRGEGRAIDIADNAGQVADLAVAIEEAGFFLTGRTVAKKLHRQCLLLKFTA